MELFAKIFSQATPSYMFDKVLNTPLLWIICGSFMDHLCRRGVVVITTAHLRLTKPEFRFCAGSNPAGGVSEIPYGEDR